MRSRKNAKGMTYPTFTKFKEILASADLDITLYLHVIEGTPYIFRNHPERYQFFRSRISSALDTPMKNIVIVGSARMGFSLNPYHIGREFSKTSDVDIVVVSARLFDMAWLELIRLQPKWYNLTPPEREMVEEHVKLVYWGNIRPDRLPGTTQISKLWLETFGSVSDIQEFSAREARAFLFRTWWQVQSFYIRALKILRSNF